MDHFVCKNPQSLPWRRMLRLLAAVALLTLGVLWLPGGCGGSSEQELREAQAQAAQAKAEAQRQQQQKYMWIMGLAAGACVSVVVMLAVGIHIGSHAVKKYRQEHGT